MYWIILSSLVVLSVAEECSYNHLTNTTLYPKSSIKNGAQLLVSSHLDEDLCYQGCCEDTRCDVSLYYAKKNKNTHSCFYFKCNDKCIFKPSSSDVYSSVRVSRSQPQDAFLDLPSVSTNPPTNQDNSNKTDDANSENDGTDTSDRLVHVTNTTHEASDHILSTLHNITSTVHDKNTEVSDGVKSGGSDSEEDTDEEEEDSVNNESEDSEDSGDDTDTDANNTEDSVKGDKSSGDKPKEVADTNNNITHNNVTDSTNKTKDGNHGKGTVVNTDSNSNKTDVTKDNSTSVVHSKDGGKHNSTGVELKVEMKTEIEVEEGAYSTRDIVFWSAVIVGSALILFGLVSLIKVYRSKRRSFYSSLTDDYLINGMYSI